jgi:NADPH-dependent F420 reductase
MFVERDCHRTSRHPAKMCDHYWHNHWSAEMGALSEQSSLSSAVTVAIVGGTGKLGTGLALRFAQAGQHVLIGSRDASKAEDARIRLSTRLDANAMRRIRALDNRSAIEGAEISILTIPFQVQADTLSPLAQVLAGQTVVSTAVPLQFSADGYPEGVVVPAGSASEQVAELLPASNVVGAFHTVSSASLARLKTEIREDTILTGDEEAPKIQVANLVRVIGLRPVDGGLLRNSRYVEGLTVLLLAINRQYGVRSGVRFTGIAESTA